MSDFKEMIMNNSFKFKVERLNTESNLKFMNIVIEDYLCGKQSWTEKLMKLYNTNEEFNSFVKLLSDKEIIISKVVNGYSTITMNEQFINKKLGLKDKQEVILKGLINRFKLTDKSDSRDDLVKVGAMSMKTGLVRKGFAKVSYNKFKLDTKVLNIYKDRIVKQELKCFEQSEENKLNLSSDKFQDTMRYLFDNVYCDPNNYYSVEGNVSDSRGRSIYRCTSKIFNPVSSKRCRALIKIKPVALTEEGKKQVYLSIAEILKGNNFNTIEEKELFGKKSYEDDFIPSSLSLDEEIWITRLYKGLDNPKYFDVPVELDVTSSMVTIESVLFNSHKLMKLVNLIYEGKLNDAWRIEGVKRNAVKATMTPTLYGSNAEFEDLLDHKHIEYTDEQLDILNDAVEERFGDLIKIKDYIINNCTMSEELEVQVDKEIFNIYCNKEKVTDKSIVIPVYETKSKGLKLLSRPVYEKDINSFRRYTVTCLVHNLDSQIANYICENIDWVITNHDAFVIHPNDSSKLRKVYLEKLTHIYNNRHEILFNYFNSIGISFPKKNYDIDTEEIKSFSGINIK